MKREDYRTHSFIKIFTRKFSKTFPVLLMVLLVFSVSAYAWLNNSASNKGNSIKTSETLAKIELYKDNQVVYSADNLRELNQIVNISGADGDSFILKIYNSGEVAMRYLVSAVTNDSELVTMQDDGTGLKGKVLNVGESDEYTISAVGDYSAVVLRLQTSYTNTSPDELGALPEIPAATQQVTAPTEKAQEKPSEEKPTGGDNNVSAPTASTEKATDSVTNQNEPTTEVTEPTEETVAATEPTTTEAPTTVEQTEPTEEPTEAPSPVVESVTDPTEVAE